MNPKTDSRPVEVYYCSHCYSQHTVWGVLEQWRANTAGRKAMQLNVEVMCRGGKSYLAPLLDNDRICATCMRDLHHKGLHGSYPAGSPLRDARFDNIMQWGNE